MEKMTSEISSFSLQRELNKIDDVKGDVKRRVVYIEV
jgi:hypothetical protein